MKVAFCGSFANRVAARVRPLLCVPCDVIAGEEVELLPQLADVDVLVSMAFSQQLADAAPRLRLLQVPGAGLDRIDRNALRPETLLANAYGHETGIAEYVIGAMITLSRSFARLDSALRQGRWDSQWAIGAPAPPLWPELAGKTLGILGFGHIGEAIARRALAFGLRVVAVRRRAPPAATTRAVGAGNVARNDVSIVGNDRLDDVLRAADFLAITLPLSPETRHLLDDRRLRSMKPTAYLINVARGEIVEENALYDALADGRLAGAALDVWYRYPAAAGPTSPATRPFHELANVLMTPHASGWTEGMVEARAALIADNIARTGRGEAPRNAIDPMA